MKQVSLIFSLFLCLMLTHCGNDAWQNSKTAFAAGDYNETLKLLGNVKGDVAYSNEYYELVSLAYMNRGKQIFDKTKNIEAFKGNYRQSQKVLPKELSQDFRSKFSMLILDLAEGCLCCQSDEFIQRKNAFDFTIQILKTANEYDSTNTEIQILFGEANRKYFQDLIAQANQLYKDAQKKGNPSLYISARDYLELASKIYDENQEIKSLKTKIRKNLLPVLDKTDGLALAITDKISEKGFYKIMLAIENFLKEPALIDPANLQLVDRNGKSYQIDIKEMELYEVMGRRNLKKTKLDRSNPYTDGIVIFSVPEKVQIDYLSYIYNQEELTRKYF